MTIRNYRTGVITFQDGTAITPNTLAVTFDGNFTVDIPGVEVIVAKDRGELPANPCLIEGDEMEITGSFDALVQGDLSDNSTDQIGDVILGEDGSGAIGSGWTSTTSDTFTLDILYTDGNVTLQFDDCIIRGSYAEAKEGNRLSFTFTCPHAWPTVTP